MTRAVFTAAALIVLAALPLFVHSNYVLSIAVSGFIFVVCAAALNLIYGFAGLLSFAQLGFWGIGGYVAAIAVIDGRLPFAAGVILAGVATACVALIIGVAILRTNRHAFVIVTLTFALLCALVARDWISVTRGPLGIPGLPPASILGYAFSNPTRFYYLAFAFAVLALGLLYALVTSRIGLLLKAIKQNDALARSQGISPMPYKLMAFVLSAALTGMAGGIYVFHLRVVDPTFLDFYYMQTFLIFVVIGGPGSFWGVVIASALMVSLPEVLRFTNEFRMVIYGVVLVLAMLVIPRGLAGVFHDRRLRAIRAALT
ncbi:MAG: branched-chain amino acid transport system permease protein [Methylobacteriaceae bacterium]|jgi:ABC-type branched-subunit amino acid transport system permease subunit|nr:branched-chain amino acid transport system permease protein [Methylobacteriaceae bacterium]